jgi:DNA-binding SARP family transcriptional activator/type II secretory pathway predicted ATPase ExeA
MEFRILGPLEVIGSRGSVRLGGTKQRALLTVLLLNADRPVSAERLAAALWGDEAPNGSAKTVQVHVSRLRKALGEDDVLATTPVGYRLRVRAGELDAQRFGTLADEGQIALDGGHVEQAAAVLREALSLWRGPPLEDVAYEPFAQTEIRALEEQRLAALNNRVQADLAAGRHGELLGELQRLLAASPRSERWAAQLMLALYRCGRQDEALEVFRRTRASLDAQGLAPGPELRALEQAIIEQAPALDLQPSVVAARASTRREPDGPFPLPPVFKGDTEGAFVGRDADIGALEDVYAGLSRGVRRLTVVCGEPGIGKTRLAREFALRAHEHGAVVLYGRCDEEALLALQPFVEALRHYVCACPVQERAARLQPASGELRRILPELASRAPGLPQPLSGDPDGARSRLFEAVGALLCEAAQRTPVVLVLDDLHWADKATLLLLKYLMRYPRDARLMVLGTYRETELELDHPLGPMLAELARERVLERRALAPLDAAAVSELVGVHAGEDTSADVRRMVYEETEGNAFFVVEVLRHLRESGAIGGTDAGRRSVPEGVKDVIGQRVRRLGEDTSRVLATAAVLGREFEFAMLRRLSDLTEDELVDRLDAAVRAHVIEEVRTSEQPTGRYTFSHALIRDTLYGALSATRRALMHRRAGAALETAQALDLEPRLAELAHHFAQAGHDRADLDKAIDYGSRAGAYATSRLAYEQAAAHFRQTVQLIDAADRPSLRRHRCDLVIAQGEAERRAGDPAYRPTLLDGARLARELHDPHRLARAALANNRGVYSSGQGVDRERVATLHAALDAYDDADSPTRAALLALLALELAPAEDSRLRDKLRDDALAMARRVGDPRTLALVLTQRCVAQWTPNQTPAERESDLREALDLADRLNDPLLAGHAAYLGAHAAMNHGDLAEADRLLARLSGVAEQLAQPFMRWYDAVARAKRCAISGPADEAERLAFAAFEIGHGGGHPDTELWFLGQVLAARFLQGALDRGGPHLPDLVGAPGSSLPASAEITVSRSVPLMVGAAMSVIHCEVGRLEEARGHFELLMRNGLEDLTPDYTALVIPVYASVACARLGDTARARLLIEILEPHSDRLVTTGASWFGATTHYLGLLAATLGRPDEADAQFAAAERTYVALGAEPWLARLHHDRVAALAIGERGEDHGHAVRRIARAPVQHR